MDHDDQTEALSSETLKAYLDAHRFVWDMPSLTEIYPEIVAHLEEHYLVHHHDGAITVSTFDGNAPETFAIDDVRHVVDVLLSREYRAAVLVERVLPAFSRLSA